MPATDYLLDINADDVRALFSYDRKTGLFTHRTHLGGVKPGRAAGYIRPDGYVQIKIKGRAVLAHRLAWLWVHGEWPHEIDHINLCRSDNRLDNLRLITRSANCVNINVQSNNKSGCTGVYWLTRKNRAPRWVAYITLNRRRKVLGRFVKFEDAVACRKKAEAEIFDRLRAA